MGFQLAKSAIDLGIVVRNGAASLAFYRDLLGLEHVGDIPLPIGGGGTMHRVQCGDSIVTPATDICPGVRIGIVDDPDRNWVEFVETS